MGIASDSRVLDPPLKGKDNNNGGHGAATPEAAVPGTTIKGKGGGGDGQLSGVRWRVLQIGRRIDSERRLVILRGYARAEDSKLHPVQIRAMIDSGAQTEIISADLARRLGGSIAEGRFGVAVEAFGRETPLTQQARNVELRLPGTNPRSLLSQDFLTRWDFIVSPQSLSSDYDILLGTRFLRRFRLNLTFHEPCVIRLTAADGLETMLAEELSESGAAADQLAAVSERRGPAVRPISHSQRRAARREWRESEEWRMQQAALAAQDPTMRDSVMTMDELEQLWATSAAGTVKIFMMQSRGFVDAEQAKAPRQVDLRVSAVQTQSQEVQDGSRLPLEEQAQATNLERVLQADFADVFPDDLPAGVPPARGSEPFRIDLKEGTRPFGRYGPRMTEENTRAAGEMIKQLLSKGFIRPSRSPWGSPMFLVAKPDGGQRMVIDYRALNAATTRNRYPLPRVDELFDQLQGARYFSKLDLRTGYWQIRIAAEDVPKTAFTSRHGHFEWLVLPMGLTNAPAEFMALMENTFREELNNFVIVFLDDILVYSRTLEEHHQHLRVVLQRLRDNKLYAKLSKCCFFRQEVEFLGHFVGRAGVRMVEGKVAAVERWPTPTTQKEVEQFLGLAGYYRRFIADFSKLASPLSELCGTLRKAKGTAQRAPPRKSFVWAAEQQEAFEKLKAAVTQAPCLAIPDPQLPFVVHTDASGYATGAVLMQQFDEGMRPIAFLSKKMTKAERNYPVHEQELLAILNALKAWRHYLGGRRFSVLTDHQSLQYVETSAMATPRQVRWAAWLSEFDFSIKYSPGRTNVAADALSRGAAGKQLLSETPEEEPLCVSHLQCAAGPEAELLAAPRLLISAIGELAPLPVRIRTAAAADDEYQATLLLSRDELEARKLVRQGRLLYRDSGQLVVPASLTLRTWLLSSAHDTLLGGHHSGAATAAWLAERVWWPNMAKAAADYVRGCEQCQRNKPDLRGKQGLPLSIDAPAAPWEVICMDFIGPLPCTARGHDTILVVIDKLTRWVYYIPTRQTASAQDTFALIDRFVLANHDTPKQIISDRDTRFTSRFWEDLWATMRTQLKRSTAFHPQTDGSTERANRTLIEQLRSYVDEHQGDWDLLLPQLQRANNSAVCFSTGFSPFEMNHGRKMRTELDAELEADAVAPARAAYPGAAALAEKRAQVEAEARVRIEKAQKKQQKDAQQGRRPADMAVGDKVWLSNRNLRLDEQGRARKLEALYFGPYEVLAMHGSNAAKILLPAGSRLHPVFNLDLLRKFVDGQSEFPERPAHNDRPGPVPEEDPAAGGPAAAAAAGAADAEPEYEVEAIIGSRGHGLRQSYRVKWRGWPIEQASWRPAAECHETCPERVRQFEETQRQRRRAVHVIRELEEEKSERRLAWTLASISQPADVAAAAQPFAQPNITLPLGVSAAAVSYPSASSTPPPQLQCHAQAAAAEANGRLPSGRAAAELATLNKNKAAGGQMECMGSVLVDMARRGPWITKAAEQEQEQLQQQRAPEALKAEEQGAGACTSGISSLAHPLAPVGDALGVVEVAVLTDSSNGGGSSDSASVSKQAPAGRVAHHERMRAAAGVASSPLHGGNKQKQTKAHKHRRGGVSYERAGREAARGCRGAKVQQHASAAAESAESSMQVPLPLMIAAEAGRAGSVAASSTSHAYGGARPADSSPSIGDMQQQASLDSAEEQRTRTLSAGLKEARRKESSCTSSMQAQESSGVSVGGGGVSEALLHAARSNTRRRGVGECSGSLSQSFRVGKCPPTPHARSLGMQRDGR